MNAPELRSQVEKLFRLEQDFDMRLLEVQHNASGRAVVDAALAGTSIDKAISGLPIADETKTLISAVNDVRSKRAGALADLRTAESAIHAEQCALRLREHEQVLAQVEPLLDQLEAIQGPGVRYIAPKSIPGAGAIVAAPVPKSELILEEARGFERQAVEAEKREILGRGQASGTIANFDADPMTAWPSIAETLYADHNAWTMAPAGFEVRARLDGPALREQFRQQSTGYLTAPFEVIVRWRESRITEVALSPVPFQATAHQPNALAQRRNEQRARV